MTIFFSSCGKNIIAETIIKSEAVTDQNDNYFNDGWVSSELDLTEQGPVDEIIFSKEWSVKRTSQSEVAKAQGYEKCSDELLASADHVLVKLYSFNNAGQYLLVAKISLMNLDSKISDCSLVLGKGNYETYQQNYVELKDILVSYKAENKLKNSFLLKFVR